MRARVMLRVAVACAIPCVLTASGARAQEAARSPLQLAIGPSATRSPDATPTATPAATPTEPPFAASLQIVAPGPQAEPDGMSYRMTLAWSARPGAVAYRVFTWTDAVRGWYRTAQSTTTRIDVHAFRSGCTAFIVVAVANANAPGNTLLGLETTNVVRFPLSARPDLCPAKGD